MSIVPKEVAVQWVVEYDGPDMTLTQWAEYIANRAAKWALEQTEKECQKIGEACEQADNACGAIAAMQIQIAIRALHTQSGNLKGGSDGQ